jgi:hypothetical protein
VTSLKIASTPKIENESQQSTSNRVHFVVYVKLFTITGITWVFQIIDSFLPMSALSTIVSILNALQGVFICVSYICNERVLRLYKDSRRLRHGYKTTKTSRLHQFGQIYYQMSISSKLFVIASGEANVYGSSYY